MVRKIAVLAIALLLPPCLTACTPDRPTGANPSASPAPLNPSTAKSGTVSMALVRDEQFTQANVFTTGVIDLETGRQYGYTEGNGHLAFSLRYAKSGPTTGEGYWLEGVDTSGRDDYRVVRFANFGFIAFDKLTEAPELGYNTPLPGRKSTVEGLFSGQVIAFKVEEKGKQTTYGKVLIRDLTPQQVTFEYVWQPNGSRRF